MNRRDEPQPQPGRAVPEPGAEPIAEPEEPIPEDPVDTWGPQSFPASDPPQWWAGPPD